MTPDQWFLDALDAWETKIPCNTTICPRRGTNRCRGPCGRYEKWLSEKPLRKKKEEGSDV